MLSIQPNSMQHLWPKARQRLQVLCAGTRQRCAKGEGSCLGLNHHLVSPLLFCFVFQLYLELRTAGCLRCACKIKSTCETSSRGVWHMLPACTSYIWGRIHPGTTSLLICLGCEQSHAIRLTCAADRDCQGICLCKYQEYFQHISSVIFKNESVQMNCSDVPRRLYKSVGGFGATLQTACSLEQDHRHGQVTHRCQSLSSFQHGKEQHLNKNCQGAGKGRNQEEEKEEAPSSCMGSRAGELPAAGCG